MRTRILIGLAIGAWVTTFTVLLSPTLLARAEVMQKASTSQLIDAQTVAFQSAAPALYAALGLSLCILISVSFDERYKRRLELADQKRRQQIRERNGRQISEIWARDLNQA